MFICGRHNHKGRSRVWTFSRTPLALPEIGRADGHELDAIIGALTLQRWEIKLDPKTGTLDLERLRRREFTEF